MITDNLKNWLANNAGVGGCYSSTGISYTDPDGIGRIGSTGDVINAFVVAHLVGKNDAIIIAGTNYTQLYSINENNDVTIDDIAFVYNNDGDPVGEPTYCTVAVCIPVWRCSPALDGTEIDGCGNTRPNPDCVPLPPGLAGVFEFIGEPVGIPSVTLDLTALEMKQNETDYHFEMNNITLINTSDRRFYAALEVRLFAGRLTECPVTGAVFTGMDRVSTTRDARIKTLDFGETETMNADFYQPATVLGIHTVCLLVHGAWLKEDLQSEIAGITG